jgi:hypothetical protein
VAGGGVGEGNLAWDWRNANRWWGGLELSKGRVG